MNIKDLRCALIHMQLTKTSLEFLDIDVSTQAFKSNWPIFTNTNDTPPSKYLKDAEVKSSYIANGVFIDGAVENSILGRNVKIGKGAVVKNSIFIQWFFSRSRCSS